MILPPKLTYCGLTIILDNPSRFDNERKTLLSGFAGTWFNEECLQPEINRWQCEIRTRDEKAPYLPGTKCILALGQRCLSDLFGNTFSIGEQRGSPLVCNVQYPVIASYLPQDACDIKDWEGSLNPLALKTDEDEGDDEEDAAKTHGRTSRSNYGFWLQKDTKKAIRILTGGVTRTAGGCGIGFRPVYYPEINEVIQLLDATKDSLLYIDIETDYQKNLLCIGFCFNDDPTVWVVPVFRYNMGLAYEPTSITRFLRSLSLCMRRNVVVAHNGFGFDYIVMAWKYKMLLGHTYYDTMIAQHRIYPEVEKSLGHCISLWTDEPYHKAEGIIPPRDRYQEEQLWAYNAKDVSTTRLVRRYQLEHAAKDPGLVSSIQQGNSQIYPYLVTSLMGCKYDVDKLNAKLAYNDRMQTQYLRCMKLLTGLNFLPTSNKQCADYFHERLGYPVVGRSLKTKMPKLGEKELQKLKLKFPENPMIDFCLAFRAYRKESGSLGFEPWKKD